MGQYNNLSGLEATSKTRSKWTYIPRSSSSYNTFELPPLFKAVSPLIRLYSLGFIFILVMELYATFGVALGEGVPIEIIAFLILLDILFAYFPHLMDGKINRLKNHLFVAENTSAPNTGMFERKILISKLIKLSLYSFLLASGAVKLFLFFQTYPFYDTYQAYIVMSSYSLGAVLHILCTGHVLMYFLRFKPSLRKDRVEFEDSNGKKNSFKETEPDETHIDTNEKLTVRETHGHNQKIINKNGGYYLQTRGILFDEELNDLISDQETTEQMLAVAVVGKKWQLSLLSKDVNPDKK